MKSESEVAQSCPTLSDPMDCSPPGSSICGILQARVLERDAIAFSEPTQSLHKISKHLSHLSYNTIPTLTVVEKARESNIHGGDCE